MIIPRVYSVVKPAIPRRLQVRLRQQWVRILRARRAHEWPIDEGAAQPPTGWAGWPEGKRFALVLTHDVETDAGQQKCAQLARMEEERSFQSCFLFVPERYEVSDDLRHDLTQSGFEVGVHGLRHDGKLFSTRKEFDRRLPSLNRYLQRWDAAGFRSPCMYHNLDWIGDLDVEYDLSTFDVDPFEPQPDGAGTIFPFWVPQGGVSGAGYAELPYTLPQDWTTFILLRERGIDIWKQKLDWICEKGGMALMIVHPDYMCFDRAQARFDNYPAEYYAAFLDYVKQRYEGQYWHALPRDVARLWRERYGPCAGERASDSAPSSIPGSIAKAVHAG